MMTTANENATIQLLTDSVATPLVVYVSLGVAAYVSPVSIVAGSFNNVFVLSIFSRDFPGVSKASRYYYNCLALADLCALIFIHLEFVFLQDGLLYLTQGKFNFAFDQISNLTCHISRVPYWWSEYFASWVLLLFSLERTVAVYKPFYARRYFTAERTLAYLSIVCLFALFYQVNVFFTATLQETSNTLSGWGCYSNPDWTGALHSFTEHGLGVSVPYLTSACLTIAIIVRIKMNSMQRLKMTVTSQDDGNQGKREMETTACLLAISTLHICILLPSGLMWCTYVILQLLNVPISDPNFFMLGNVAMLFYRLGCISHSVNLYMYVIRLPAVKEKFLRAITLGLL